MKRREWLQLAGSTGLAGLFSGCATRAAADKDIDFSATERLGGEGYGVWKNGRRAAGRNPELRRPSLSITKTLAALAVVRTVGDGWLTLDRPLVDLVPEWRNTAGKDRVTVRMLVNLTAGFTDGVAALYRGRIDDKGKVAIALPLVNAPETQFRYGPASDEILGEVLRRAAQRHGSTTEDILRGLMGRLGISSPNWRQDAGEKYYLSTGAEFSVDDLGRLGTTVAKLAAGDDTAGLQSEIFRDLAAPRTANPMFSAGIWWNRNARRPGAISTQPERNIDAPRSPAFWQKACLAADVDAGWLAMVGSGGKRVCVLPEQRLVIARVSHTTGWDDGAFLRAVTASSRA